MVCIISIKVIDLKRIKDVVEARGKKHCRMLKGLVATPKVHEDLAFDISAALMHLIKVVCWDLGFGVFWVAVRMQELEDRLSEVCFTWGVVFETVSGGLVLAGGIKLEMSIQ